MKPVVTFRAAEIIKIKDKRHAKVAGYNGHPRFEDGGLILTSEIVSDCRNEEGDIIEFETLNTIYREE